jgi:hypothetical protein
MEERKAANVDDKDSSPRARRKVFLQPGRSIMDWNRLVASGQNLAGTSSGLLLHHNALNRPTKHLLQERVLCFTGAAAPGMKVTKEELKKV